MIKDRIKELRRVPASELINNPKNWRIHPNEQAAALRSMLESVGMATALIARETPDGLELIDGHLRKDIAEDENLPVLIVDLNDQEADQVLATLDPLSAMATADGELLNDLIAQLPEIDFIDYESLYDDFELPQDTEPSGDPDDVPEVAETPPVTQPGDVWLLGNHRLICGDSTDPDVVKQVLDGKVPNLMVTDPPYGVDYDPKWRAETGLNLKTHATGRVSNDKQVDWSEAWKLFTGDVAYVYHGGVHTVEVAKSLVEAGFETRYHIVWNKNQMVISRGNYHWKHETIWHAIRKGAKTYWIGDRKQTTVWDISKNQKNETNHATQKPVECMERPIRNHSGDVYDPFCGSGSTVIAAERQGRACYAIELEPKYCDVIVERWETYTGNTGVRVAAQVAETSGVVEDVIE